MPINVIFQTRQSVGSVRSRQSSIRTSEKPGEDGLIAARPGPRLIRMEKLQNRLKLVRSQSMGQGVGQGQDGPKVGGRGEGRVTQVVLLDDRRLEMVVQPRLYAGELLDIVASHCGLREKEYK